MMSHTYTSPNEQEKNEEKIEKEATKIEVKLKDANFARLAFATICPNSLFFGRSHSRIHEIFKLSFSLGEAHYTTRRTEYATQIDREWSAPSWKSHSNASKTRCSIFGMGPRDDMVHFDICRQSSVVAPLVAHSNWFFCFVLQLSQPSASRKVQRNSFRQYSRLINHRRRHHCCYSAMSSDVHPFSFFQLISFQFLF